MLLVKFSQFEKYEEMNTVEAEPQPTINEASIAPTEEIVGNKIDAQAQRIFSDMSTSQDSTTSIMKIVPEDVSHRFKRMEK